MDRITPVELERIQLKKSLFGYSRGEVDALLERIVEELESLLKERASAEVEVGRLKQEIEIFRAQESTLKEAIILAQKTADETKAAAHKEAELIVQDTLQKSDKLAHDLQIKVSDLRWEVEKLRLERQKFLKSFRSLLEGYMREVEQAEQSEAVREQLELDTDEPSIRVI
jgi:cell division initiation protein